MSVHRIQNLIVPEKSLEDWACDNLDAVIGAAPGEVAVIIGRQVSLQNGRRADIIALVHRPNATQQESRFEVVVVELKREMATPEAVAQLLEYIGMLAPEWGRVRGVLAAPAIDSHAAHCINGAAELSFTQILLDAKAHPFPSIHVPDEMKVDQRLKDAIGDRVIALLDASRSASASASAEG